MKKLLITTMAAVSVGLCAKANLTAETFESYDEGSLFGTLPGDSSKYDITDGWETETTLENLFTVTNIANYVGAGTYPEKADRPSKSDSVKALAIDTSAPLLRYADSSEESQSLSDDPIFFDSVVQFTATDVAPSMENNTTDKLAVWLYQSPEDVSDTNPGLFNETTAKKTLVITAGVLERVSDGDNVVEDVKQKNYDTGIEIEPESWHRLTIKSFLNEEKNKLMFNVWIDGAKDPITAEGVTDFLSLVNPNVESDIKLQGVAFDGKGAVDDIVFTTTAPEFAKEDEPEAPKVFNVAITTPDGVGIVGVLDAEGNAIDTVDAEGKYVVGVDTETITVVVEYAGTVTNEGAELIETGTWGIPVDVSSAKEGDLIQVEITVASGEEPEDPEDPAKPTIGGAAVETAEAFIAAANSGVAIKVPTGWTLDGNTLKDADGKEYATFADYYTVTLETDGTVTLKLNDNAKPTIGETATDADDAIVLTDTTVSLGVTNAKDGLWYGVQEYSDAACTTKVGDVTGWAQATGETVTVTATKPEGDKAFFKVVVDDQDHSSEEQN